MIFNNEVPGEIAKYFRDSYFFCLHKDANDPSKLRSIAVPSALRHAVTSHVTKTYKGHVAQKLLPYQYAVGVEGGMDFVIKTVRLAIEKYITTLFETGRTPSCAIVFAGILNMFNVVSREELMDTIRMDFPEMLSLTHLI